MQQQKQQKNNMKLLRNIIGRTQAEAAMSSHMSTRMWQLYEYGKVIPPLNRANAIALALDSRIEDVFPGYY